MPRDDEPHVLDVPRVVDVVVDGVHHATHVLGAVDHEIVERFAGALGEREEVGARFMRRGGSRGGGLRGCAHGVRPRELPGDAEGERRGDLAAQRGTDADVVPAGCDARIVVAHPRAAVAVVAEAHGEQLMINDGVLVGSFGVGLGGYGCLYGDAAETGPVVEFRPAIASIGDSFSSIADASGYGREANARGWAHE